jgi:hypothetical protein
VAKNIYLYKYTQRENGELIKTAIERAREKIKYVKTPEHRRNLSISAKLYWAEKRALAQVQRDDL